MHKTGESSFSPGAYWLALLLGLVAIGGAFGADSYFTYQAIDATERSRLMHQVDVVRATLSLRLQTTNNALDAIRQNLHVAQAHDRDDLNRRLMDMVAAQTGVRSIVVMNAQGDSIASNRRELIGLNFHNSERYRTLRQAPDFEALYLSAPFVTPLGNYAISVGKVLQDAQGRFDGYVLAIVDPDYFGSLLQTVVYEPGVSAWIVHGDGKVAFQMPVAAPAPTKSLGNLSAPLYAYFVQSHLEQGIFEGAFEDSPDLRETAFGFIRPITGKADKALVVAVSRKVSDIFAPWRKELALQGLLLAGITLCATAAMRVYLRRRRAYDELKCAQEAQRQEAQADMLRLNAELEHKVTERTRELAAANERLRQLSLQDSLTGLPNRLAANERLESEFKRMKRSGTAYAVLMIDVDFFKQVNDTYGHGVGDAVLRGVGDALNQALRGTDFVARFGGEEFLVLLPDTDMQAALGVAEKIRQRAQAHNDPVAGTVTVSIGVAMASQQDANEEVALQQADRRLYDAKKAGRNRVAGPENATVSTNVALA